MRHLISPLDFTVEETYEVLDFATGLLQIQKLMHMQQTADSLQHFFKSQVPE